MAVDSSRKPVWRRLDNASKLYASTSSPADTKVFRFTCELFQEVQPDVLQQALDRTIGHFPYFQSVLRRGVFWSYLESSDLRPIVEPETKSPLAPLYHPERRGLLLRVSYYHCRIHVEIFHALTDGTGAVWFTQTLLDQYLSLLSGSPVANPLVPPHASLSDLMVDSFGHHYEPSWRAPAGAQTQEKKVPSRGRVFVFRGVKPEDERFHIIEGATSVRAVLDLAHQHRTTLTVFLTAVLLSAIYEVMPVRQRDRRIRFYVPVNLRQFFSSKTMRNFFSNLIIDYQFPEGASAEDLTPLIEATKEAFERGLDVEQLNRRLNRLMKLEKNFFLRILPLPLKDYILRLVERWTDRSITGTVSNVGRVSMRPEVADQIKQISVMNSSRRTNLCILSYGDRLTFGFTSPWRSSAIERAFFRRLSAMGLSVEVASNQEEDDATL